MKRPGRSRRSRADASTAPRRSDVNIAGLVREAVDRALLDAGLEHKDIDAIVIGKAPDMLEGVMQPEQFLVGAVGGAPEAGGARPHRRLGRRLDGARRR